VIVAYEPADSYSFAIPKTDGRTAHPHFRTVSVIGHDVTVSVVFS